MGKRIMAVFLSLMLFIFIVPADVIAVTGNEIAADGVYSSTLTGYKKGKAKYTATLGVQVEDGIISSLWLSNVSGDKMFKAFNSVNWEAFVGIPATCNAVQAVEDGTTAGGADVVSSASVKASKSSSDYSVNLKETILRALRSAPVSAKAQSANTLTGSSSVDSYSLTLQVSLSDSGTVSDIAVADGSTGNWDTVLSKAKTEYLGKTQSAAASASEADAVSSATKYSAAFYRALGNALGAAAAAETTVSAGSTQTTTTTASGTIADGIYTYTADVKGYFTKPATIPATVTVTVADGKFTAMSVSTESSYLKDQYQIEGNFNTLKNKLIGQSASVSAIEEVAYTKNVSPNYPNESTFNGLKAALLSAVSTGASGGGTTEPPVEEPAETTTTTAAIPAPPHIKSISPAGAADDYTIHLNVTGRDETATTTGTAPGSTVTKGTNLVMVIDISGSIVGKESALNSAIRSLVNGLPDSSQVGIVLFNDSASSGKVYSKSDISGLKFSGVEGAGTNMATGIAAADSLLNGSGWNNKDNNKAMVIISDFDADDYADSINNAKTAKSAGTTVYSVKIDTTSVGAANRTELTTDARAASIPPFTRYVSSQYPAASAVNDSMFGMFNQADVTAGTADTSANYVFGAGGGDWNTIFAEIQETQQITTETEVTLPAKGIVIRDVLSDYVELSGSAPGYGITVDGLTDGQYSVSVSGKTVTVTFSSTLELADGVTYTVNIPVRPSAYAQKAANESGAQQSVFPSNQGAVLTYQYGDSTADAAYAEAPTITVLKENTFTLSYDANGGTGAPDAETKTVKASSCAFTVSAAEPEKEGYTFGGWLEAGDDADGDHTYQAGDTVTLYADLTLTAIWEQNVYTVTWLNEDGTVLEKDENVPYGTMPGYDGAVPEKAADAQYSYTFSGWSPAISAVTGDVTYTAQFTNGINDYTVQWIDPLSGDAVLDTQTVSYGAEIPAFSGTEPDHESEGQRFIGWNTEYTGGTVTGNIVYIADYAQMYQVFLADYTNGAAAVSGIVSGGWYLGEVSFTVSAANAAAFGRETTGIMADDLRAQNGTYQRMYCTDNGDGSYTFTLNVTETIYLAAGFKGDADLNGSIQLRDSTLINQFYSHLAEYTNLAAFLADANGDGNLRLRDSTIVNQAYSHIREIAWDTTES